MEAPQWRCLLDHLVSSGEERGRYIKIQRFGRLYVNDQKVFGWPLHRHIGGFSPLDHSSIAAIVANRCVGGLGRPTASDNEARSELVCAREQPWTGRLRGSYRRRRDGEWDSAVAGTTVLGNRRPITSHLDFSLDRGWYGLIPKLPTRKRKDQRLRQVEWTHIGQTMPLQSQSLRTSK